MIYCEAAFWTIELYSIKCYTTDWKSKASVVRTVGVLGCHFGRNVRRSPTPLWGIFALVMAIIELGSHQNLAKLVTTYVVYIYVALVEKMSIMASYRFYCSETGPLYGGWSKRLK